MNRLMSMKKVFAFCIPLLLFCQFAEGQKILPYISPGYGFSWDFSGHFISSPKLSIGILPEGGIYYNITIGASFSSNENNYPNVYCEAQCGRVLDQSVYGGGIGLTIPAGDNESRVSLRVSGCTGFLIFLNATVLFSDTIQTEFGGQAVLPIPLAKFTSSDD